MINSAGRHIDGNELKGNVIKNGAVVALEIPGYFGDVAEITIWAQITLYRGKHAGFDYLRKVGSTQAADKAIHSRFGNVMFMEDSTKFAYVTVKNPNFF